MVKPQPGTILSPTDAMDFAIALAYLGANRVSPNPHVGCVVLDRSYKLLSYGYHEYFGGPHAEVNALKEIPAANLEGAHVFVSLEPCSHHGKTPPCANFLASLPIESLTYGVQDPNPEVAGRGLDLLRKKGIQVHAFGDHSDSLEDLLLTFRFHLQKKEAFIALKIASSLDGVIADPMQKSQWITSQPAREYLHFVRSRYHALLVGKNTALVDNPSLNVRHPDFSEHSNKVLVLNKNLDLLPKITSLKLFQIRKPQEVILIASKNSVSGLEPMKDNVYRDPKTGVLVIGLNEISEQLDLHELKKTLPLLQIYDVLVEGGTVAYSSFLEQGAFDHLYLFQAPIVLGTQNSRLWSQLLSRNLEDKIALKPVSVKKLGEDILLQFARG